jgi:hypothetical protein
MMEAEWLQTGALAAGGLAVAGVVYAIVRWVRKVNAIFPEAAKKYGLTFTREKRGGALGNVAQSSRLRGVANGTPIEVISTYETRGRMRMRSTVVASRALAALPSCTMNILRQPPAAKVHLVPTGDAQFDRARWVTSDAPAVVRTLLTAAVRTELLRCPQDELRLVVTEGHLVLSFPDTPGNEAELHGPMDVVLAAAATKAT